MNFRKFASIFYFLAIVFYSEISYAEKTNNSVYEDPFDIASGGAALTRATQSGILFQNPAQLPYGGKFLRWLGLRTTLILGKESVDLAQSMVKSGSSSTESNPSAFIDRVLNNPIHAGSATAISFLTNNGGIGLFYRVEPDIVAERYTKTGLPGIALTSEAYAGGLASLAFRTPFRWLSLGVTGKYLLVSEKYLTVDLSDMSSIDNLAKNNGQEESLAALKTGIGFDAGMLLFFQGPWVDIRIAAKVDDFGDTKFSGGGTPESFKQTLHGGAALTFHNDNDAIHLEVNERDILQAYGEPTFKRTYLGAKILLRGYLGLGAGLYQGFPSYGAEIDLIIMRLTATYYRRELSNGPGLNSRGIYQLSLTSGFDF